MPLTHCIMLAELPEEVVLNSFSPLVYTEKAASMLFLSVSVKHENKALFLLSVYID